MKKVFFFFSDLQATRSDIAWLNRFFLKRGVPPEYIHILLDQKANRQNIISTIRKTIFSQVMEDDIRLFIFFSGHGIIVEEKGTPSESVLITHDTSYNDILTTGILISELVKILKRLFIKELYIFLDACFMSINSVARTFSEIPDLDLFKSLDTSNCFLCMVANHESKTIEPINGGLGLFTKIVIKSIENLEQNKQPSISKLVENIQNVYLDKELGKPYVIFAGLINNWPFFKQTIYKNDLTLHFNEVIVPRNKALESLIFFLRENSPRAVFLIGQSGIGKTTLLYELSQDTYDAVFIHITKENNFENILKYIISMIVENRILSNFHLEDFNNIEYSFKKIVETIPQLILCLDGIEYLEKSTFFKIINFFETINIQICATLIDKNLLASNMLTFDCPPFSYDETKILLNELNIYEKNIIDKVYIKSEGFPLKIKHLIVKPNLDIENKVEIFDENQDLIIKVITTNGYIDKFTFSKKMDIDIKNLECFEKLGYIIQLDNVWFPHDELFRYANKLKIPKDYYVKAMEYWCHEKKSWRRLLTPSLKVLELFIKNVNLYYEYDYCIAESLEKLYTTNEIPLNIDDIFNILKRNESRYLFIFSKLIEFYSNLGDITKISHIKQVLEENYLDSKQLLSLKPFICKIVMVDR